MIRRLFCSSLLVLCLFEIAGCGPESSAPPTPPPGNTPAATAPPPAPSGNKKAAPNTGVPID